MVCLGLTQNDKIYNYVQTASKPTTRVLEILNTCAQAQFLYGKMSVQDTDHKHPTRTTSGYSKPIQMSTETDDRQPAYKVSIL